MRDRELGRRLDQAFRTVERACFMRSGYRDMAPIDAAFPIGHGQTISQPYTLRNMLRWLAPQVGQRVLDVGCGSGWSSALLGQLVGPEGRVYAVERIPELKRFGEENCRRFGCPNIEFHLAGDEMGLPAFAPYDRILVSAAAEGAVPPALIDQLGAGGRMVIPVDHAIHELIKDESGAIARHRKHHGYSFVPLIDTPR